MPRYANPVEAIAYTAIDVFARRTLARRVELRVIGAEHLPPAGATLIAARHYHSLLDGLILLRYARRPAHLLVALDWLRTPLQRMGMELACRIARWPAVLRTDEYTVGSGQYSGKSAYQLADARPMLRSALSLASALLRASETLVVFPEAYPNVDPIPNPKDDGRVFLPFEPGFVKIAQLAERDSKTRVAIVPAGFEYAPLPGKDRWRVTLRYGPPRWIDARADAAVVAAFVATIEREVKALSLAEEHAAQGRMVAEQAPWQP